MAMWGEKKAMTDYTPLFPVMIEDPMEFDWMNVEWWIPRARALAARIIHEHFVRESWK